MIYDIFCSGPSVDLVSEKNLESDPRCRIAINASAQRDHLNYSLWAMRDPQAFRYWHKQVGDEKVLMIPRSWDDWRQYGDSRLAGLIDEYDRFTKELFPTSNDEFERVLEWDADLDFCRCTMTWVLGCTAIRGASDIRLWGADFKGKYKNEYWHDIMRCYEQIEDVFAVHDIQLDRRFE